jgi:transposase
MPKLLRARPAKDADEETQVRRVAASRHAPGDWIQRAQMITLSWEGLRTAVIAQKLRCHQQTVRERIIRFNAEGLDGLGDRSGSGRRPRITELERSAIIALVATPPPGALVRRGESLAVEQESEKGNALWSLDALGEAAIAHGIQIGRSQVRRILRKEGVRWREVRSWAKSADPEFIPKGQ